MVKVSYVIVVGGWRLGEMRLMFFEKESRNEKIIGFMLSFSFCRCCLR